MRQGKNVGSNNKRRRMTRNPRRWIILGVIVLMGFVGMPGSPMADSVERRIAISFSIPDGLKPEEQGEIQKIKEVLEAWLAVKLQNLEGVEVYVMEDEQPSAGIDDFVAFRKEKKSDFSIHGRFYGPLENSWSMDWQVEERNQSSENLFHRLKGGYKSLDKKAGFKQIETQVNEITREICNRIDESVTRPKVIFTSCFTLTGDKMVGTLQALQRMLPADLTMHLEAILKERGYELLGLTPSEVLTICVRSSDQSTLLNYKSRADYIIDGQITPDANPDKIAIQIFVKEICKDKLVLKIERRYPLDFPDIKELAHYIKEKWIKNIEANQ
jgi:hypothetical protein